MQTSPWKLSLAKKFSKQLNKVSSFKSNDKGTRLNKRSIIIHCVSSTSSSEEQLKAPKLNVMHQVNVALADNLDYKTYRFHKSVLM